MNKEQNIRPMISIRSFGDEWLDMVYALRNYVDVSRFERELGAMTIQYDASEEDVVNYIKKTYGDTLDDIMKAFQRWRDVKKELHGTRLNSPKRADLMSSSNFWFDRAWDLFKELTVDLIDNEVRFTEHDWPWRTIKGEANKE